MFSLLLPVYYKDSSNWLKKALDSALVNQGLKPSQVVIVCDGEVSSDLNFLICSYKKKFSEKIDVLRLEQNEGLGTALNKGLTLCRFDLVARLDADDECYPNRFHTQVSFMKENTSVDILGSSAVIIDDNGIESGKLEVPSSHEIIYKYMWACPIIHPSVMFRKSKILGIGSYSTSLRRRQDYELWFRCASEGCHFHNLQEPLIKYRVTDSSYKRNSLSVAWTQYKIGRKGVSLLGLGVKARLGVMFPVVKALLPPPLRKMLTHVANLFDPRGRAHG